MCYTRWGGIFSRLINSAVEIKKKKKGRGRKGERRKKEKRISHSREIKWELVYFEWGPPSFASNLFLSKENILYIRRRRSWILSGRKTITQARRLALIPVHCRRESRGEKNSNVSSLLSLLTRYAFRPALPWLFRRPSQVKRIIARCVASLNRNFLSPFLVWLETFVRCQILVFFFASLTDTIFNENCLLFYYFYQCKWNEEE